MIVSFPTPETRATLSHPALVEHRITIHNLLGREIVLSPGTISTNWDTDTCLNRQWRADPLVLLSQHARDLQGPCTTRSQVVAVPV